MQRLTLEPRADRRERARRMGFAFADIAGEPYWDETACYRFTEAEIDTLQDIDRLLGSMRSTRSDRIDAMQADLDGLAISAQALAARLAPELATQPAPEIALALAQQLEGARQAQERADQLQARLDKAEAELHAAHNKQQAIDAGLAPCWRPLAAATSTAWPAPSIAQTSAGTSTSTSTPPRKNWPTPQTATPSPNCARRPATPTPTPSRPSCTPWPSSRARCCSRSKP